ncbi:hypothetical protein EVAR_78909_1 [Eumeta japonica]|uniref:Uncharacterized protein n=1 Tax=Eumeta variegata TaxID=151549 RepID=A0A4C1U2Q0_EUMVA|nr:hypothetical protein EVAR_78909_1 [Eumeta japonica]
MSQPVVSFFTCWTSMYFVPNIRRFGRQRCRIFVFGQAFPTNTKRQAVEPPKTKRNRETKVSDAICYSPLCLIESLLLYRWGISVHNFRISDLRAWSSAFPRWSRAGRGLTMAAVINAMIMSVTSGLTCSPKYRECDMFLQSHGSEYLASWAENMRRPQQSADPPTPEAKPGEVPNLEDSVVELVKNDKGHYEIHQPAPSNMPAQVLNQLKKLYGRNPETEDTKLERRQNPKKQDLNDNYPKLSQYNTKQRSKEEIRKVTEDLSNVDLD